MLKKTQRKFTYGADPRKTWSFVEYVGTAIPPDITPGNPGDVYVVVQNAIDDTNLSNAINFVFVAIYTKSTECWEKWEHPRRPRHPLPQFHDRLLGITPRRPQPIFTWLDSRKFTSHLGAYNSIDDEAEKVIACLQPVHQTPATPKNLIYKTLTARNFEKDKVTGEGELCLLPAPSTLSNFNRSDQNASTIEDE
ncbi:hypothetical protein FA15DRAFT_756677 [Coprinopsis marcescibilis]|uniref:Uncharacterized protein n=1 Tax=Coprinopsis marcescibilis TaxID=230819 RepID=A0A5C3KV56_COPMA|nr:hypothetical protein FA15DRAFT_756677 [Coprinopsis marcescibilis]